MVILLSYRRGRTVTKVGSCTETYYYKRLSHQQAAQNSPQFTQVGVSLYAIVVGLDRLNPVLRERTTPNELS